MAAPPRPTKGAKPWLKGQTDDLASLPNLDEQILLEELKQRYDNDSIYTYVGDILVAVNPFRDLPIYTPEIIAKYSDTVKSAEPPHIYAIADQAYWSLRRTGKDQCAVISGESGAGKTESAKLLIRHIITLCHMGAEGALLENKIIQVNPLLEAFGNAQTLMNHNSSRFGKYTELKFNEKGGVVGAQISEYLLEKSRVVRQLQGERNFHIFYYIFAAPEAQSFGIRQLSDFTYTRNTDSLPRENTMMYKEVAKALNEVGFSPDEFTNIHRILAGILHLGNITYDAVYADTDPASMSSAPAVLKKVAEMIGLEEAALKDALMVKVTITRGDTIRRPYSVDQAVDCRDAFAKALYGRLFGWIVSQINELLAPGFQFSQGNAQKKFWEIGILDIFGFEHFQENGFEQLCINVANEQLQHFFNQHIFAMELNEYKQEGIDGSHIKFQDNSGLLELFMKKPVGIFSLLDEETHFPKGSDNSLVAKFKRSFASNASFKAERTDDPIFGIHHYAGEVQYTANKFLEKNRDTLPADIVGICQQSTNQIVRDVFLGEVTSTGNIKAASKGNRGRGNFQENKKLMSTASKRTPTLAGQFTNSLKILINKMQTGLAHFVRCIKPNHTQSAKQYNDEYVRAQLRYTGMLETTRIRREGYSFRPKFEDFMERFGLLGYGANSQVEATAATCKRVMTISQIQGWQIGRTKVFLKYWHVEQLDKQIRVFGSNAIILQKCVRGFLARRERYHMKVQAAANATQALSFFEQLSRGLQSFAQKQQSGNAEDMRRQASGAPPKRPAKTANVAPPRPQKSEIELKREASILWWREKEQPRGAGQDGYGNFLPWFHGIISRKEAERMLAPRNIGCFLVRVSENRFGYTLSYRIADRCRHYMVEQDTQGRYALVGVPKVTTSLNELIDWFRRNRINDAGDMLREPCGQELNDAGEEECDYGELLGPGQGGFYRPPSPESGPPPPIHRKSKPASEMPPPVSRSQKPAAPRINRAAKPSF